MSTTKLHLGKLRSLIEIKSTNNKFVFHRTRDGRAFITNWLDGVYPADEIEPAIDVAQRISRDIIKNIATIEPNTIDIYITHDSHLMILLHHLVGIRSINWEPLYLDGFILQLKDDMIVNYHNGNKSEVKYPMWWKNLISDE